MYSQLSASSSSLPYCRWIPVFLETRLCTQDKFMHMECPRRLFCSHGSACFTAAWLSVVVVFCSFVFSASFSQSAFCKVAFRWCSRLNVCQLLFHAAPQHLIGCYEHDADDESDGEGAYQALADASLLDLLRRAGTWREKKVWERERGRDYPRIH